MYESLNFIDKQFKEKQIKEMIMPATLGNLKNVLDKSSTLPTYDKNGTLVHLVDES